VNGSRWLTQLLALVPRPFALAAGQLLELRGEGTNPGGNGTVPATCTGPRQKRARGMRGQHFCRCSGLHRGQDAVAYIEARFKWLLGLRAIQCWCSTVHPTDPRPASRRAVGRKPQRTPQIGELVRAVMVCAKGVEQLPLRLRISCERGLRPFAAYGGTSVSCTTSDRRKEVSAASEDSDLSQPMGARQCRVRRRTDARRAHPCTCAFSMTSSGA
jgi:hypothetical protein